MKEEYNFELFADYFQFILLDEGSEVDTSDIWNEEQFDQMLAVYKGVIIVGTVRNMTVPFSIEIHENKPESNNENWNKINECSITIQTGRLVIMGCTEYYPDAARILIKPGIYRARVQYGGLDLISEDGLEGEDHYKVILWPDTEERPIEKIK